MKQAKNTISYRYFGIAGLSSLAVLAFLSFSPVAHAYSYGGSSGNYSYGNSGSHGGNYSYGGNGGSYNYGGHSDQDDHSSYHPVYNNYDFDVGHTYSYYNNSTPVSYPVYYPVSQPTYYQQPVYYQQPIQQPVYYQQPINYVQPAPTFAYQPVSYAPTYNTPSLTVTCAVDPSTSLVNQPVTWTAGVTGGVAPYTYSWSGSGGLTGSQNSVTKNYSSVGNMSAVVIVTSADGLTSTHSCDNTLTVRGNRATFVPQQRAPAQTTTTTNNQNAAAAGLSGVSWLWLALIIILLLIVTIIYLATTGEKKA